MSFFLSFYVHAHLFVEFIKPRILFSFVCVSGYLFIVKNIVECQRNQFCLFISRIVSGWSSFMVKLMRKSDLIDLLCVCATRLSTPQIKFYCINLHIFIEKFFYRLSWLKMKNKDVVVSSWYSRKFIQHGHYLCSFFFSSCFCAIFHIFVSFLSIPLVCL